MPSHTPHLCPTCEAPLDANGCCDEHGAVLEEGAGGSGNGRVPKEDDARERDEGREQPRAEDRDEDENEDERGSEGEAQTEQSDLGFHVPTDVIDGEDELLVFVDAPGVSADDFEVVLEEQMLTIRGERSCPYDEEGDGHDRRERAFGRFERVLYVPRGLDPEAVEASLADGVLSVRIPRSDPAEPRVIPVTGGRFRRRRRSSGKGRSSNSRG